MKDALVVLMTLGFFGLCFTYVALCDRIIGPDPDPDAASEPASEPAAASEVASS